MSARRVRGERLIRTTHHSLTLGTFTSPRRGEVNVPRRGEAVARFGKGRNGCVGRFQEPSDALAIWSGPVEDGSSHPWEQAFPGRAVQAYDPRWFGQ